MCGSVFGYASDLCAHKKGRKKKQEKPKSIRAIFSLHPLPASHLPFTCYCWLCCCETIAFIDFHYSYHNAFQSARDNLLSSSFHSTTRTFAQTEKDCLHAFIRLNSFFVVVVGISSEADCSAFSFMVICRMPTTTFYYSQTQYRIFQMHID